MTRGSLAVYLCVCTHVCICAAVYSSVAPWDPLISHWYLGLPVWTSDWWTREPHEPACDISYALWGCKHAPTQPAFTWVPGVRSLQCLLVWSALLHLRPLPGPKCSTFIASMTTSVCGGGLLIIQNLSKASYTFTARPEHFSCLIWKEFHRKNTIEDV